MQYTIKAGILYKNEPQRALARIKSALIGPQRKIFFPSSKYGKAGLPSMVE